MENSLPPRRRSSRGGSKESTKNDQLPVAPGKSSNYNRTRSSFGAMEVDEDEVDQTKEESTMRSNALKAADEALKKKTRNSETVETGEDAKKKLKVKQKKSQGEDEVLEEHIVNVDPPPAPPVQNKSNKGMKRRKSGSSSSGGPGDEDKENLEPAGKKASRSAEADELYPVPVEEGLQGNRERSPAGAGKERGDGKHAAADVHSRAEDTEGALVDCYAPTRFNRPKNLRLRTKNSDPTECLDRIDDMYDIYFHLEDDYAAKPYMDRQDDINRKMRAILVDWMVEVHSRFKLQTTTLWLSVNILDRYLMQVKVVRAKLQLVGISAMLIACKYEEQQPPEVQDCVVITDYAYEREELLEMEKNILISLNYDIMVPTGHTFLSRYLNATHAAESTRHLAGYYAERNLQEIDSLSYPPHHVAAAAIFAANVQQSQSLTYFNCQLPDWNEALELESGLSEAQLVPYAKLMVKHVGEETETASKRRLTACKKKFSSDKYGNVSKLRLPKITTSN